MSKLMKQRWSLISPGYHQTHTITTTDLNSWLKDAGFNVVRMRTFGLALKSFSKTTIPVIKQIEKVVEKTLELEIQQILKLLSPFNLGDTIYCAAKRII